MGSGCTTDLYETSLAHGYFVILQAALPIVNGALKENWKQASDLSATSGSRTLVLVCLYEHAQHL